MTRTNISKKTNPYGYKICVYCKTAQEEDGCVKNMKNMKNLYTYTPLYRYTNIFKKGMRNQYFPALRHNNLHIPD